MPLKVQRSTTERGLGWQHQKQVAALKAQHVDGTPCWWCGQPMFLNSENNWDKQGLAGDHSVPRASGGTVADRLLHATCNKERGDGARDHLRPALTGKSVGESLADTLGRRLMPWPF
ncbi:HNH endonuclease [Gordonia phage Kiko]|nr:HNH endonuclease [Gordonia phage Kiko]